MNETHKYNIMHGLHSDHNIITFHIGSHELKRGIGMWKFKVSLLYDVNY